MLKNTPAPKSAPTRQWIIDFVRTTPRAGLRETSRAIGLGYTATAAHLSALVQAGTLRRDAAKKYSVNE